MAPILASSIDDLITATLKDLGRLRYTQIAQELQYYVAVEQILRRDRAVFDSGESIRRNLMLRHGNEAKMVGLYAVDNYNVGRVLDTINVPWRHANTNYVFERRELLMNRNAAKIVDLIKTRRDSAMLAQVELMEEQFWGKPADDSDTYDVYGVQYWITPPASYTADGFAGGTPSGFSTAPGGLDHANFKNWHGRYTNATRADLGKKMREAHFRTRFRSPLRGSRDYRRGGAGDRFRIYTNYKVYSALVDALQTDNDSLGVDVAQYDGQTVFKRNPINIVPQLDNTYRSDDPVYMIDMGQFFPVFLRGDILREEKPMPVPGQHNARAVDVDTTYNILCDNRRAQALINTAN